MKLSQEEVMSLTAVAKWPISCFSESWAPAGITGVEQLWSAAFRIPPKTNHQNACAPARHPSSTLALHGQSCWREGAAICCPQHGSRQLSQCGHVGKLVNALLTAAPALITLLFMAPGTARQQWAVSPTVEQGACLRCCAQTLALSGEVIPIPNPPPPRR
ncbi:hypothetical protein AAFF_G00308380 [Aldrovandia affinis]|uniref:Uncharacterized protein n=1 Tax=Aldrovandia affinis TaxID=143900 RepID=A0AAD7SNP6_9TELE|nr:hypothetical protein AAFF_G00308380 [Aldrovandia affinis]